MTNVIVRPRRHHLSNEIDRMFDSFFGGFNHKPVKCDCYSPAVDIREGKDQTTLTFSVPGIDKDQLKIVVEDRVLTVSGERKDEHHEENEVRVVSEINYGEFSRSFTLPDTVDTEKISADYKNGLLIISLARAEAAKPKQIAIH